MILINRFVMKTKSLILILFMAISTMLVAQEPAITLRAPSTVGVGQQFSVTYEVNARPSDFKTPTFTDFNFFSSAALTNFLALSKISLTSLLDFSNLYFLLV